MKITRKGIFVKDSNQWFNSFKNTLFYQVLEFLIHTTENEIDFNNGIRILKSGDNKIFFEYVADNEFHKKTVNDIIELMKEKEKNHE
jgi:hypothetical protein|nr:MAG TPA: hypothetical protein [Caudoviricetes sp.]